MKKLILAVTVLAITLMAGPALGQQVVADLIAGNPKNEANVVGTVTAEIIGTDLVVTYMITEFPWLITETHLAVSVLDPANLDDYKKVDGAIPQTKKGNAIPGKFDPLTSADHDPPVTMVMYTIPLSSITDYDAGDTIYIAAHAVVEAPWCEDNPLDLPDEVTVSVLWFKDFVPFYDGAYFLANVSGGTALDGTYDAWCVDTDRSIRAPGYGLRETPMQAEVYLSFDCGDLPVVVEPLIENCGNMGKVNWILNNVSPGDPVDPDGDCDGAYTVSDIQQAIWQLVDDTFTESGLDKSDMPTTYDLDCRVPELLAAAEEDFVPDCDGVVGVILLPYVYMLDGVVLVVPGTAGDEPWPGYPGDPRYDDLPAEAELRYVQPIIIKIPVPCCDETAWAGVEGTDVPGPDDGDGYIYEFPGNDWSMYFRIPEDD